MPYKRGFGKPDVRICVSESVKFPRKSGKGCLSGVFGHHFGKAAQNLAGGRFYEKNRKQKADLSIAVDSYGFRLCLNRCYGGGR